MTMIVSDDEDDPPLQIPGAAVDEDGAETSSAADEVDNNEKKDVEMMEAMVDVEVTNTEDGDAGKGGMKAGKGGMKQAPVLKSFPPVTAEVDNNGKKDVDVKEAMVDVEVTNTEAGDAGKEENKQAPILKAVRLVIDNNNNNALIKHLTTQ